MSRVIPFVLVLVFIVLGLVIGGTDMTDGYLREDARSINVVGCYLLAVLFAIAGFRSVRNESS